MDDSVDTRSIHAEEPMRLDDLKCFVHHRRGVDGDLGPHTPGRVVERLLDRRVVDALLGPGSKRPTRSCQDKAFDLIGLAPGRDALEDRTMLGVDRDELDITLAHPGSSETVGV